MSARARGWLAALVAVAVMLGLAVLSRDTREPAGGAQPSDTLVAGRPAPPAASVTGASPPAQERTRAVRDLLDRRATAVIKRDEAAFMATVDPLAAPEFVVAQRALFGNLGGVPLSEWRYELDAGASAQTPKREHDAARLWAPRTTLRYALLGADAVPTARPLGYLYAERGGTWYLTSDSELGAGAERTWRGPWDFGPCIAVTGASGLVLGHPGSERLLAELAADLDGAVAAVTGVWGQEWSRRVAVVLPGSVEEMRELVGPEFAVDGIAAAAVADKVDVANHTAIGQRVVLHPDQAGRLTAPARRIVLRHELTHVAARASTVDGAPMWLLEGFADFVGYLDSGLTPREAAPDLVRAFRETGPPASLPADEDFRGDGGNLDLAYQLAWSAALHIVDRAGQEGLVQLYRLIAGDPDRSHLTVDNAMITVLSVNFDGFVASWRDSLSRFS